VVISRDGGATWSASLVITPAPKHENPTERLGAFPVVAPDGTAFMFYAEFPDFTGPLRIRFSKSSDGGQNWSLPSDVASDLPSPGCFLLKNAEPDFGTVPNRGVKANSFPAAAVAPDGTLYVAWTDFPNGSCINDGSFCQPCTNADVRLSASRNDGLTWTVPVKVSDEAAPTDQFFPAIATHSDGRVSIVWQDRRLDPENVNYDTFYSNTTDGTQFLRNERVSSASSHLGTHRFIGDYNGLAVTARGIFPVWCDIRLGNPDIFTAAGKIP